MIYSLDISVVDDLLEGHTFVRDNYEAALDEGAELRMCATILYHLAAAARGCSDPHRRLAALSTLLSDIEVEPFTGEDAMAASSAGADYLEERWRDAPKVVEAAGQAINRGWVLATSNAFNIYPIKGLRAANWGRADPQITNIHDVVAATLSTRPKEE